MAIASINNAFVIRNDQNTLGRILSGGVPVESLFSPYNLYTYVLNNSSSWANGGSGATNLGSASANWQATYTYFSQQSANNLEVYTRVNLLSSNWQNTYTNFALQSANNLSVYSLVNTATAGTFNLNNIVASGTITASSLKLGASTTSSVLSPNYLNITGAASGSVYQSIRNTYPGASASTDLYLYNDTGTNRLDIGINSTAWNGTEFPVFNITKAGDSYVYATNSNLVLGAGDAAGNVTIFTGGTTSSNERVRITNNGNVGIGTNNPSQTLSVVGTISSSNIVYANNGNSTNWNSAYTDTTAATNLNTPSTIVKRDSNGTFTVNAVYGNLSGVATKVSNPLTFNSNGLGVAPGTIFDGTLPQTISYNTIGAAPLSGSANVTIVGTVSSGTWQGSIIAVPYGGTGSNNGSITGTGALTFQATGASNGITLTPGSGGSVSITNASISGSGSITGTTISGSTGSFTTLGASSTVTLDPAGANVSIQPSGAGTVTIKPATQGNIDNMRIGGTTAAAGTFTSLQAANASVTGDLTVNGNFFLAGSASTVNQNILVIDDPVIYLANNNPSDGTDIGFVGHVKANNGYSHTGLLRSNPSSYTAAGSATGTWYLFSSMVTEPSANSVYTNTKVIDTLVAHTSGNHIGNTSTATALLNPQNISISGGDMLTYTTSFNGTSAITLQSTINSAKVTYDKMQRGIAANFVLGVSTGASGATISEQSATTLGFNLLNAQSADGGAHSLGLGSADTPTFQGININNTSAASYGNTSAPKTLVQNFYGTTSTSGLTISTVSSTTYRAVKFLIRVVNTTDNPNQTAICELLANYDPAASGGAQWVYTVYGLIDNNNLISSGSNGLSIGASASTVDLVFVFNGNKNYAASVVATALV